jgi:hypothetical protein
MVYFGNGTNNVSETCGSAMWTKDNKVASFFQYYDIKRVVAYSPSVDLLIGEGYKLHAILYTLHLKATAHQMLLSSNFSFCAL